MLRRMPNLLVHGRNFGAYFGITCASSWVDNRAVGPPIKSSLCPKAIVDSASFRSFWFLIILLNESASIALALQV